MAAKFAAANKASGAEPLLAKSTTDPADYWFFCTDVLLLLLVTCCQIYRNTFQNSPIRLPKDQRCIWRLKGWIGLHLLCINNTIVELQPPILLHFPLYSTDTKIIQATHSSSSLLYLTSSLPSHPPPPPTPHNRLTSPYSLPPIPYEQLALPEQLAIPPPLQTPHKRFTPYPPARRLAYFPFLLLITYKQATPPHQLTFISLRPTPQTPHLTNGLSRLRNIPCQTAYSPPVSLIFFSPLIPHSGSLPTPIE